MVDDEPLTRRIGEVGAQFGGVARATNRAAQPQATGGNRFQALAPNRTPSQSIQQEAIRRPTRLRLIWKAAVEEGQVPNGEAPSSDSYGVRRRAAFHGGHTTEAA